MDVIFSKPLVLQISPFPLLPGRNFTELDAYFLNTFYGSGGLKRKYDALSNLWEQSFDTRLLILIKDYKLLVFSLQYNHVREIDLLLLEGMRCFNVFVYGDRIIIGLQSQILIVDFKTNYCIGIDFIENIPISFPLTHKHQKAHSEAYKSKLENSKEYNNGQFHSKIIDGKVVIKGIIGTLKEKTYKAKSTTNELPTETNGNSYILTLLKVFYSPNEFPIIINRTAEIEYNENSILEPCLIVKTDIECEDSIILINSSNKSYSQILLFNFSITTSARLRPVDFLSGSNNLPADKNEKAEILMIDAQWSANRLFVVVLFVPNYFCVLSRLGHPLNLVYDALNKYLYSLPTSHTLYLKINITEKNMKFLSGASTVIIDYESKINFLNIYTSGPYELVKLISIFPELAAQPKLVDKLKKELNFCLPLIQKKIKKKELDPDAYNTLKCAFDIITVASCSNNMQEIVNLNIEKMISNLLVLMYSRTDPFYLINLIEMCKNFTAKEDITIYDSSEEIKKLLNESNKQSFGIEKIKALITLYCYFQFRSINRSNINLSYLERSIQLNTFYKTSKQYKKTLKYIMSILKLTSLSLKEQPKSKIAFNDMGLLQKAVFELHETSIAEDNKLENKEESKEITHSVQYLLGYYKPEVMENVHELIKLLVRENPKAKSKLDGIVNSTSDYISYIYSCIELLKVENYKEIFKSMQVLAGKTTQVITIDRPIVLAVMYSCLLLTALKILKDEYVIDIWESHNLLYRVFNKENALSIFNKLKKQVAIDKTIESTEKHLLFELKRYIAVGILFQISEDMTAIKVLLNSSKGDLILLGLIILNNHLNASYKFEKWKTGENYAEVLIESTTKLLKGYLYRITKKTSYLFSIAIALSSKLTGTILFCKIFPWLVKNINSLLYELDKQFNDICKSKEYTKIKIKACPFLESFAGKFYKHSSLDSFEKIFGKLFNSSIQAIMSNKLIQETMQLLCSCLIKRIIKFSSGNAELFKISKVIPSIIEQELRISINELLFLLWKLLLILLTESKPSDEVSKLSLGSVLLRASSICSAEQKKLEVIQKALNQLKEIDYGVIDAKQSEDVLHELGNAFDIYTEGWESIVKEDINEILLNMKNNNPSVYIIIKSYISHNKYIINKSNKNIESDLLYIKMIKSLKDTLMEIQQEGSFLSNLIKKGKILSENLRNMLNNISKTTGLSSSMAISREDWTLASAIKFQKSNDDFDDNLKITMILNELLKEPELSHIKDNSLNYHINLPASCIKMNSNNNPLMVTNNTCLISYNTLYKKQNKVQSILRTIVRDDIAIDKIVKIIHKSFTKAFIEIKTVSYNSALKVYACPLVSISNQKKVKPISLRTKSSKGLKPFELCHIKRNKLSGSSMDAANRTKKYTEEINSQKFHSNTVCFVYNV